MKKGTRGLWGIQESHAGAKEKSFDIAYLWLPVGIKKSVIIWMGSARIAEGSAPWSLQTREMVSPLRTRERSSSKVSKGCYWNCESLQDVVSSSVSGSEGPWFGPRCWL